MNHLFVRIRIDSSEHWTYGRDLFDATEFGLPGKRSGKRVGANTEEGGKESGERQSVSSDETGRR